MNREWSELNKTMQEQIRKSDSFTSGINTLLELRRQLMELAMSFKNELNTEDFSAMPFKNAKGYHSKTIAYSLWHIFRIEDIVAHTLIKGDEQVFFANDYQNRIGSPIVTTGNELADEQIADFSKRLDINELYKYISDVDKSTTEILKSVPFENAKVKISQERKQRLQELGVVSNDENACWLIDYWCGKDINGLIKMPFSRHWIMHIEACLRIRDKIVGRRQK